MYLSQLLRSEQGCIQTARFRPNQPLSIPFGPSPLWEHELSAALRLFEFVLVGFAGVGNQILHPPPSRADGARPNSIMIRTVFSFIGAFLLSMLVAGTIAVQIAISTGAREEFIIVFMALELFGLATIIVFALVYGRATRPETLTKASLTMFAIVRALSVAACLASFASHRSGAEALNDLKIFVSVVIVAGLVILIQQWLITRRWRKAHPLASPATT